MTKSNMRRVFIQPCEKVSKSLSWRAEKRIIDLINTIGDITIADSIEDDVDLAEFYNLDSFIEHEGQITSLGIPFIYHAYISRDDFNIQRKEKTIVDYELRKDGIRVLNKAACVIVFFETQKEELIKFGVTSRIEVIHPIGINYKNLDELTKAAFKKVNQIYSDNKYVTSIEEYEWRDKYQDIEILSRIMPNIEFFNLALRKAYSKKFNAYSTDLKNNHFLYRLSIPLIPSLIHNSAVHIIRDNEFCCLFLMDYICTSIPVLSLGNIFLDSLLKKEDRSDLNDIDNVYNVLSEKILTGVSTEYKEYTEYNLIDEAKALADIYNSIL